MFTDEQKGEIELLTKRYPQRQSAILAALWMWQDTHGWISPDGMKAVAEILRIPEHVVLGVVTFYTMFNRAPVGRHKLEVCTSVSCMLRGSDRVLARLRERLRVEIGGTTSDGRFTLVEAECLGSCGTAPVMQVGDTYHENLNDAAVDALLDTLR